ncbi:MAG: ribosome maturation factor RimM [Actinomycetes bacterium]|nr:ribosome maturation factor RimM [Actinomycetes bacterium]MDX5380203.1 ribosome maturation factor RimM [Actinomycetes bacterium]MDX5398880.1 ribosome maturation factor RimM [Actinomycetes bacterium]MDX5449927.1 ribosome maturation factor RimM [Actinomycetes bacterium]
MQLTVAVVAGAHGLKGHVRLAVRTDDPDLRFRPGVVLDTDHPDLPELTVAEVMSASGSWRVRFEEVVGRDAAEALRGTELSIETDEWESGEDEWYDHELVGLPALTPEGERLGTVTAVEHGSAQDLLVVGTDRGPVRVPFVTALVPQVSAAGVVIRAPGGLFDGEEA